MRWAQSKGRLLVHGTSGGYRVRDGKASPFYAREKGPMSRPPDRSMGQRTKLLPREMTSQVSVAPFATVRPSCRSSVVVRAHESSVRGVAAVAGRRT